MHFTTGFPCCGQVSGQGCNAFPETWKALPRRVHSSALALDNASLSHDNQVQSSYLAKQTRYKNQSTSLACCFWQHAHSTISNLNSVACRCRLEAPCRPSPRFRAPYTFSRHTRCPARLRTSQTLWRQQPRELYPAWAQMRRTTPAQRRK